MVAGFVDLAALTGLQPSALDQALDLPQGCPVRLLWLNALFLQCMDRSIALTQARYLEREEKCLPPPRLVDTEVCPHFLFLL